MLRYLVIGKILVWSAVFVFGSKLNYTSKLEFACDMVSDISCPGAFINKIILSCRHQKNGSIGTQCTNDTECLTDMTVCYRRDCLCTPGYSYSPKYHTCNRKCNKYGEKMTPYPGLGMAGHNSKIIRSSFNEDYCVRMCLNERSFLCVSVDFNPRTRCGLQEVGYLDVEMTARETGAKG